MIRIEACGAEAILLVLSEEPYAALPQQMRFLVDQITHQLGSVLTDWVAGWTTLLLHYDVTQTDHQQLSERLMPLLRAGYQQTAAAFEGPFGGCMEHVLPVCYDGVDLPWIAQSCGLSVAQVIQIHQSGDYEVGAVGFAPGFAYLGGLDARLALPRRSAPRVRVEAGSVAIVERQTAVYPQASPGGWHLLGRCPWPLFQPKSASPVRLHLGDRVRFMAIDAVQYGLESLAW